MNLDSQLAYLFQEQMNRELYNHNAYCAMAGIMETVPYDGMASWLRKAAAEELEHYKKFNDFLVDRNVTPEIHSIPGYGSQFVGPLTPKTVFSQVMSLEQSNTQRIIELDKACEELEDCDAEYWLIWALEEQRKAERELTDILHMLELAGDNYAALLQIDERLGK